MNKQIRTILEKAVDLHVHIGPEIIPRKYTAETLLNSEAGRLAGVVTKNHFFATGPLLSPDKTNPDIRYVGSIVLNNAVGGMNPEAVYAASLVSQKPLVVWFPTINAAQFLKKNKYEIAPEWVQDKTLRLKSAAETSPVLVTNKGLLLPETKAVIEMIASIKGVLATGHIAADESMVVARYARSLGVSVIVTHPIYQHINMPLKQQKDLAGIGCYMEQSYSMYSMDGISIAELANQIKAVGPASVVLSSDVGQEFSMSPSQALETFAELLVTEGIPLQWIEEMLVTNPRNILGIKKDD